MNPRITRSLHLVVALLPACGAPASEDIAADPLTLTPIPGPSLPPVNLPLRRVLSVDVGDDHSCAVTSCGEVRCWGRNNWGQAASLRDRRYVEVAAGVEHTCARDDVGAVRCWGRNASGQTTVPALLDGPAAHLAALDYGAAANFAHTVPWMPNLTSTISLSWGQSLTGANHPNILFQGQLLAGDAVRVWGGGGLACASDLRTLFCVGDDSSGQRTIAGQISLQGAPDPQLDLFRNAWKTSMSVGRTHACVVLDEVRSGGVETNGWLVCFGGDSAGQTSAQGFYPGNPARRGSGAVGPLRVIDYNGWRDVAAGAAHTCAVHSQGIRADGGNVVCFGANASGQSSAPSNIFTQVSAGRAHSCGVSDGRVLCWGDNASGQSAPPAMPAACLLPW